MALQISISEANSSTGIAIPEAYIRIHIVSFRTDGAISISGVVYYNAAARQAGKQPVQSFGMILPNANPSAGDLRDQGYTYLKTLPEYAGAIDV